MSYISEVSLIPHGDLEDEDEDEIPPPPPRTWVPSDNY
jgi:hypothetical protein